MNIERCIFIGRHLLTDYPPLIEALKADRTGDLLEKKFPGFRVAAISSMKMLEVKRLRSEKITYFNFRLQVWAPEGFDADPTPPVRILPAEITTDPNGPVTFAHGT